MKYAILSDIHANLEALTVVLEKCEEVGVDKYICLGDLVGYNANPKECLDLIYGVDLAWVVKGNHDEYVSNDDDEMVGFNDSAKEAVLWTRQQLAAEDVDWLGSLPMVEILRREKLSLVHGTLDSPEMWGYVFDLYQAANSFSYQFTPLCFCGHSHAPLGFSKKPGGLSTSAVDELRTWMTGTEEEHYKIHPNQADEIPLEIKRGWKYLLNVGSVGQPRNGDPRSSFAVYDEEEQIVTRYRLPYDIPTTQAKIRAAGLPERSAQRIATGS